MPKSHSSLYLFFKQDINHRDQFAQTPESLIEHLEDKYGKFDFDPCPVNPQFDGLSVEWGTRNYVNPPFNQLKAWLTKAVGEWGKGKEVVFLMPIRLHTAYFLNLVQPHIESGAVRMYVLKGGVKFKGYTQRAPFGVMYLHFPGSHSNNPLPTAQHDPWPNPRTDPDDPLHPATTNAPESIPTSTNDTLEYPRASV